MNCAWHKLVITASEPNKFTKGMSVEEVNLFLVKAIVLSVKDPFTLDYAQCV